MLCAEMPYAAARDGLFPGAFAKLRGENGVPVFGIIASTVLASLITIFSYTRFDDVFTKIVLLSVFTAVIPYLFSAAAQLYWLLVRGRESIMRPTAGPRHHRLRPGDGLLVLGDPGQRLPDRLLRPVRPAARHPGVRVAEAGPGRLRRGADPRARRQGEDPEIAAPPVKRISRALPTSRAGAFLRNRRRNHR